jgi:hypothetical protein
MASSGSMFDAFQDGYSVEIKQIITALTEMTSTSMGSSWTGNVENG